MMETIGVDKIKEDMFKNILKHYIAFLNAPCFSNEELFLGNLYSEEKKMLVRLGLYEEYKLFLKEVNNIDCLKCKYFCNGEDGEMWCDITGADIAIDHIKYYCDKAIVKNIE